MATHVWRREGTITDTIRGQACGTQWQQGFRPTSGLDSCKFDRHGAMRRGVPRKPHSARAVCALQMAGPQRGCVSPYTMPPACEKEELRRACTQSLSDTPMLEPVSPAGGIWPRAHHKRKARTRPPAPKALRSAGPRDPHACGAQNPTRE